MTDVAVRLLSEPDQLLDQAEQLLTRMYDYMVDHGLLLPLANEGAKAWRSTVEATLGRLGALVVATAQNDLVGFAQGMIRLTPSYLGNQKVGAVVHLYVSDDYRGQGIGEKMYLELEKWFVDKSVHSVDLQVLCANSCGIAFWRKMGFADELLQMRRFLTKSAPQE
jgi:ribosomal protein S18 acetylase RimI-like enzyme